MPLRTRRQRQKIDAYNSLTSSSLSTFSSTIHISSSLCDSSSELSKDLQSLSESSLSSETSSLLTRSVRKWRRSLMQSAQHSQLSTMTSLRTNSLKPSRGLLRQSMSSLSESSLSSETSSLFTRSVREWRRSSTQFIHQRSSSSAVTSSVLIIQPLFTWERSLTQSAQHSQSSTMSSTSYISSYMFMNTSKFMTEEAICNLKNRFMNMKRLLHQLAGNVMNNLSHQSSSVVSLFSLTSCMPYRKLSVYDESEDLRYWLLNMKEDFKCESDHFTQDKNKVTYIIWNLKKDSVIKRCWQLMKLCSTDSAITSWALFRT